MDNIIKKIVLDLCKKQVELTPEQCKKLKDALDEMFGKKVVKEEHHHHHDYPYRLYWDWWNSPMSGGRTSHTFGTTTIYGSKYCKL